ncbi:MAG: TIGR03960 family B12-binding radical SAM protein [Desulfobacteraceae bacterium]|nr:MAG: TIGR03960 family B12-binding radical SAM protein [Desulfobacteraceae bacterium]
MSFFDQEWFAGISRPSRYLGNEINQIKKEREQIEVSIALAFPDIYEVGMSHLGLKILYHLLNNQEWIAAERVFCPWTDLEQELRQRRIPLKSIESGQALSDFDIIGFSLQHELCYSNVLTMLDLSCIPFLARDRNESHPLVIAGGPACYNPEPMADFFDAMVIGDGEETALQICQCIRKFKSHGKIIKEEILRAFAAIQGIYVPKFFKTHYDATGRVERIEPLLNHHQEIKKAVITDLDTYSFPTAPIVPFTELIHDRLVIEIARGCTRGCRFCQAGMIYRPVRERHPDSILKIASEALRLTGFDEVSLLSLSSGDYNCIGPLIKTLMDQNSKERIAISLPSLRIDSLDPGWFEQIKRVRKTGFTLAPEAGNDRLRRVINKNLTQPEIIQTAQEVYKAGWKLIKLYFMVGLPTEEDRDLFDIAALVKEITALTRSQIKKPSLHISISTFVPKSHTPFMWEPQLSIEESERRIRLVQEKLMKTKVQVKWNDQAMSWLEGIFSRGDRRLSRVLVLAWRKGARFDAWREFFYHTIWKDALHDAGVDPDFYLKRIRSKDECLPWDHIQTGVHKNYFKEEYAKAISETATVDCRLECHHCGVCDHQIIKPKYVEKTLRVVEKIDTDSEFDAFQPKKYRLVFSKRGDLRYLSHLELGRLFGRVFKRAGLRMIFSQGYHPLPKISFYSALPVGIESLQETIDIQIHDHLHLSEDRLKETINRQMPAGIAVQAVTDITRELKSLKLQETEYVIRHKELLWNPAHLERFLAAQEYSITKNGKNGAQIINARPLVKDIFLASPDSIRLCLKHSSASELKASEMIAGIFNLSETVRNELKIIKIKQVIG